MCSGFSLPVVTPRVATGPMGSDGQKCFAAFVRTVADAHPRVRLKLVPTADREASAKALTGGEADLAVVRSDMLTSPAAQTVAILRRDVVGLVIPSRTPIAKVRDLAGKTVGLVQGATGDVPILDQILAYYQIPADTVQRVVLAPGEIGPALDQEVEAIHARAVERVAHEAIEPEQFQVVSQVVHEVRQVIDKRRARLP